MTMTIQLLSCLKKITYLEKIMSQISHINSCFPDPKQVFGLFPCFSIHLKVWAWDLFLSNGFNSVKNRIIRISSLNTHIPHLHSGILSIFFSLILLWDYFFILISKSFMTVIFAKHRYH